MAKKRIPAEATVECDAQVIFECAEGKVPTAEIVAYTGGKMRPRLNGKTSPLPLVIDIQSAHINDHAVALLRDHDHGRLLGHASLRAESNQILASGELSAVGGDVDDVVKMAKRGFPWQASLGLVGDVVLVKDGEKVSVNGRYQEGPFILVQNAKFRELSILGIAADGDTSVAIAAAAGSLFEEILSMSKTQEGQATEQATKPDAASANVQPVNIEAAAAEARQAARQSFLDETKHLAELKKVAAGNDELLVAAIEAGWSPKELAREVELVSTKRELESIRNSRPSAGSVAIHASGADVSTEVVSAALMRTNGGWTESQIEAAYGADIAEKSNHRGLRNYGLKRLMHEVAAQAGKSCPIGAEDNDFIRDVFHAQQQIEATGAPSSLSLTSVVKDVANKALIAPFQRTASLVPFAFARRSARDFKPLYGIKLEGQGILEQLGADGEIKHATLTDSEYSVQLNTYAKMLGINRKMMINDDLGAFLQVASILGDMAFKAHEKLAAQTILAPGGSFYGATNSFSGSALSLTSLKTQYNLFLAQTDADGYPISVMPDRMLCPAALGFDMRANLNSEYVVSGNTTAAGERNPVYGIINNVLATPWLQNANVSSASSTAHFMLCNPNELAAFVVAYLNGQDRPTIESSEMNFNKLGMEFRCFWDFGFGTEQKVGVVKSAGA